MYKAVRELETNGRSGDPTPQNGLVNIREESTAARTLAKQLETSQGNIGNTQASGYPTHNPEDRPSELRISKPLVVELCQVDQVFFLALFNFNENLPI